MSDLPANKRNFRQFYMLYPQQRDKDAIHYLPGSELLASSARALPKDTLERPLLSKKQSRINKPEACRKILVKPHTGMLRELQGLKGGVE